jgi:hypothetical protein
MTLEPILECCCDALMYDDALWKYTPFTFKRIMLGLGWFLEWTGALALPLASHTMMRSVGTGVFVSSFSSFHLRILPTTHGHCCICDVYSVALRLLTGVAVFDVSFFFPG